MSGRSEVMLGLGSSRGCGVNQHVQDLWQFIDDHLADENPNLKLPALYKNFMDIGGAQELRPDPADSRIGGRSSDRSSSIYGRLGAGALALPPVPAAAQRLPRSLWQPAAWDYEGLAPPSLGRRRAPVGRTPACTQVGRPVNRGLDRRRPAAYQCLR